MKKTISSAMTFIYKFAVPVIWIGGFGFGTLTKIVQSGFSDQAISFLFATVVTSLSLYWSCMRLKVVEMDNEKLYISNYFKQIEIDKSNIAKITEDVFTNIHPVWIHFKTPTEFGMKIMFIPKLRFFPSFSSHPIVEELKIFGGINHS